MRSEISLTRIRIESSIRPAMERELIPVNRYEDWLEGERVKARARARVVKAVREGRLVRLSCEDCGNGDAQTEGHHEDYSKPMEVIWLCKKCHIKRHTGRRPKGKTQQPGIYFYYKTEEDAA